MVGEGVLLGDLLRVPDKWWGFEAMGRKNHPGACVGYDQRGFQVTMLKGTDTHSARRDETHVYVQPDDDNGLTKTTAFAIKPYCGSARRVSTFKHDRYLGRLAKDDLQAMQAVLCRLFDDED
ncbi:MAG: hypothetical protein AAF802_02865 [Planctomycetota bacterium]